MPIDALSILCAQLTRDLLAIAKFLLFTLKYIFYVNFVTHVCTYILPILSAT